MSTYLRQIEINCPKCGEYIYEVEKRATVLSSDRKDRVEVERLDPICRCDRRLFAELVRSARGIDTLKRLSVKVKTNGQTPK